MEEIETAFKNTRYSPLRRIWMFELRNLPAQDELIKRLPKRFVIEVAMVDRGCEKFIYHKKTWTYMKAQALSSETHSKV